jgi:hypothetical protein
VRDQFGLKIGWVRLWLRGVGLGVGLAFLGASCGLWRPLAFAAGPFFALGLLVMLVAGILALLTWAIPYPLLQTKARCPACGHEDRVLRLPWTTAHTCRHCRRKGVLRAGLLTIPEDPAPVPGGRGPGRG